MVKITVVTITMRLKPHFEWSLESLKNQTLKDFEYIIVDQLYHIRKDYVDKLIDDMNVQFPVIYLPDKPSRWKGKRPAASNARNTALIFANGEHIVFHDDNCRMYKDWLERHLKWLSSGYVVAGNWTSYQKMDSNKKDIGPLGVEYRSTIVKEPNIVTGGWLYGANMSFPLDAGLDINGFDEDLDGEMGQEDVSFGIRTERNGYKIMYDPECMVKYYYHSHGSLMNYSRKEHIEFNLESIKKILKDGEEHFSNEWLIEKLLEDTGRIMPYGNSINIRYARKKIRERQRNLKDIYKMMEEWIDQNKYDWRDGKLIDEKIGNKN